MIHDSSKTHNSSTTILKDTKICKILDKDVKSLLAKMTNDSKKDTNKQADKI